MTIRPAKTQDFVHIWPFFSSIVRAGDTYAIDPEIDYETALQLWVQTPLESWLLEEQQEIIGSYYIKANQAGPGNHICNCGYMVAEAARGNGAATAMCQHSLNRAVALGFTGMQYNLVVSSNRSAIKLWQKLGFEIVGTVPKSFNHPQLGLIDAHIMHQNLTKA